MAPASFGAGEAAVINAPLPPRARAAAEAGAAMVPAPSRTAYSIANRRTCASPRASIAIGLRQRPFRVAQRPKHAVGRTWFNHRRLLEPIGFVQPAEAEAAFYAKLENTAVAA